MKTYLNVFLLGLSFGWGPCLASCGPLLLTYIAGSKKSSFKGLSAYLFFSLSRIFVYLVLGVLVFFLGRFVFEHFINFFKLSMIFGGVFVILMALLMLFGVGINLPACSYLHKQIIQKDKNIGFIDQLKQPLPWQKSGLHHRHIHASLFRSSMRITLHSGRLHSSSISSVSAS